MSSTSQRSGSKRGPSTSGSDDDDDEALQASLLLLFLICLLAPQKRNGQSTWGLPMHMGGVRQAARCPYGAAKPSWAMVRCISSSHPPILYTACVGFYNLSHVIHYMYCRSQLLEI